MWKLVGAISFFCVVLLGNKADLQESRVVDCNEARNVAENLGLKYFETSAATGQNVNEAVEALLDQVIDKTVQCSSVFYQLQKNFDFMDKNYQNSWLRIDVNRLLGWISSCNSNYR